MNGEAWAGNYFNYFTEIEEHFQRARGSSLFLLSPIDWALAETWKNQGVPLEAVLRGIDDSFEKYHARKRKAYQQVNSLTYCAQAVTKAAGDLLNNRPAKPGATEEDSLPADALRTALEQRVEPLRSAGFEAAAASVAEIAERLDGFRGNLEELELRLTAIEESILAISRASLTEEQLLEQRRELDAELKPHRSRLSAAELSLLEKSFLDRRTFERRNLPRLSLFFLL
ncbi:MAG: hypothetical protein FJW30_19445 [Acidobacteria bacterium]|nr:hypothetical protein [Acidobacteriota bacterium]